MQDSPLLAGINGEKLWSESTTQTGFDKPDRTVCLSGQVTQIIGFWVKGHTNVEFILETVKVLHSQVSVVTGDNHAAR